jgi:hypothetical protein
MGGSIHHLTMDPFDDTPDDESQQTVHMEVLFENFRVYENRVTKTYSLQPSAEIELSPEHDWFLSEIHTRCVPSENLLWTITRLKDPHPIKFN